MLLYSRDRILERNPAGFLAGWKYCILIGVVSSIFKNTPIRIEYFYPARNPAEKQASCTAGLRHLHIGKMSVENKLNNDVKEQAYPVNKHVALKHDQEINNPCYKEQILSLKCLDSHQDERDECDLYFTNYRNCRKFWTAVQHERKLKNIKPYLPSLEERAKIKADYLNSR